MLVPMQLARIVIVDAAEEKASMIILREIEGDRQFPIVIGLSEAYAIDRRTKNIEVPRPMTHDLMMSIITQLDGKVEQVIVSELRNQTFYAKLMIRRNGELVEVDSRPSDAIALSAGTDLPIYVDESVLDEVC